MRIEKRNVNWDSLILVFMLNWRRTQVAQGGGLQNRYSPVRIRSTPRFIIDARVVELVDTRDLKSLGCIIRDGSSPSPGTPLFSVRNP